MIQTNGSGYPQFGCVGEIDPARPETWRDRVFLTFDIDWANDDVIEDTLDLVEAAGVKATWFITHDTPVLERLRANAHFEMGIHPNFNFLLEGDPRNGATAEEVVDRLLALVPDAKSVRSHALVQGTPLVHLFARKGLTHESNHLIPEQAKIELRPWPWFGLIKAPYFWEDGIHCRHEGNASLEELLARPGLRIFDFHPIHVYLNSDTVLRYEDARPHFRDPEALLARRHLGLGTRTVLKELLERAG